MSSLPLNIEHSYHSSPSSPSAATLLANPSKRKTVLCSHWESTRSCPFGDRCAFAHGEKELATRDSSIFSEMSSPSSVDPNRRTPTPPLVVCPISPYGARHEPYAPYEPEPVTPPSRSLASQSPLYKTTLCKNFLQTGMCLFSDSCSFAHGEHELLPRPALDRPKGLLLNHTSPPTVCEKHVTEPYTFKTVTTAEAEDALRQLDLSKPQPKTLRLDLYKTKLCKHFHSDGVCPFGEGCHYAHGIQELKRCVDTV